MSNKEPKDWITVNGKHIPIFDGESKQDAYNRAVAKSNEEKKAKEIAQNKEQADKTSKDQKLAELQKKLEEAKGIFAKSAIKTEIDMLKDDWKGTKEDYLKYKEEEHQKAVQASLARKKAEQDAKKQKEEQAKKQLEDEMKTQPKDKVEQFKIIQATNPMQDDYHVGIRKPSDIKTWEEILKSDKDDGENFAWGDFSKKDAEKALKSGKITIYSSYPIGQGVFVSTSKIQSEQYAGGKGKKVYSKVVPLSEVAWISGDEGQYAKLKQKGN